MNIKYRQISTLSEAEITDLIKYYNNHTINAIIKKYNFSKSSSGKIRTILERHGIALHSASENEILKHLDLDGYVEYSNELINSIYELYNSLQDVDKVCTAYNIKEYFLIYLLKLKHITPRYSIKRNNDWYIKLDNSFIQNVINFYLIPNTLVDTANKFGLQDYQIRALLLKNNINLHAKEVTEFLGKQKQKSKLQQAYGVNNVFELESTKQKVRNTKITKYGDPTFTNRQKAKETCNKKFGTDTFLGSAYAKKAIEKSISVRRENYKQGFEKDPTKQLYLKCYNDRAFTLALIESLPKNTVNYLADKLNISHNLTYSMLAKLNLLDTMNLNTSNTSYYEDELIKYIGPDICIQHNRTAISPYEIDIYIPSKKIGIEFNGTYWHSNIIKVDHNYHQNKSKLAEAAGIRLIHIWEYEWTDPIQQQKIKLLLDIALGRANTKIYARQCEIKQITNKEAKILNNKIHLQGHRNAQITYGLFYNNELVQLMSFSKTHYNKNLIGDNDWEIIRGCPGSNNIVVGGVSKLFKHFIMDYKPDKVFSYCDFNKFNGKSYEALGMNFIGYTKPDMKWLLASGEVVSRKPSKHAELKAKSKAQLFGAGSKKYKIIFKNN